MLRELTSPEITLQARTVSDKVARHIVNDYYRIQNQRIRIASQIRSITKNDAAEDTSVLKMFHAEAKMDENKRKAILFAYANNPERVIGRWAMSITGIGPVIAAGLMAHIDISQALGVGAIWRYAGLDPTADRHIPGQKAVFNSKLKRLCWIIGQSFVKFQNKPNDHYGAVYRVRKQQEIAKNEQLLFADQAEHALKTKNYKTTTDAYKWYSVASCHRRTFSAVLKGMR